MYESTVQDPQRIGIDTSILVNLTIKEINMFNFREQEFSPSDSLYYAMKTKYEFKGVILNKFGFDKKEKNKLWRRAKSALKLNPIRIGKKDLSKYFNKVRKANALLVKQTNPQFQIHMKIGDEDIEIIANFLKWKIGKVYTSDRAFYETCRILGLQANLISMHEYSKMKKRL
ncbi:MAG: hypothetical protein AABX85_00700 [Nanoarchaeota archaeon]